MRSIVSFLAVCLASAYGELMDLSAAAIVAECADESGVDVEKLQEMVKTNSWLIDRTIGCYTACVLKKQGMMTPDGVVIVPAGWVEGPESCLKLTGVDACDTTARVLECSLKAEQEAKKANEKKD